MFVLNIASPIISLSFIESERLLIVLSYKGIHIFSACCPLNEMIGSLSLYNSSMQASSIGNLIFNVNIKKYS